MKYFLIDNSRNRDNKLRIKCCDIASKIFLFKGRKSLTTDVLYQMWDDKEILPPSAGTIIRYVSVKNVKWYIRHHLHISEGIWNGDFVAGLTTAGKVNWSKRNFPSFIWARNRQLFYLINDSPFYGRVSSSNSEKYGSRWYTWSNVPALYLPYSKNSLSFMAGVLATGHQRYIKGESYIRYNLKIQPYLKQWSIPIEINSNSSLYISPIWPALLTYLMPESCNQWLKLPHPHKADFYASILWNVYVGKTIQRGSIPYLKSRQWMYGNNGNVKKLEGLWIDCKLAGLDKRIKEAIHHWSETV